MRRAPGRPGGDLQRPDEAARGGDGGEPAAEPVVRGEPRRRPPRLAALEHEAVVCRVREPVLDVPVERPAERLDWIGGGRAPGEGGIELGEAVVDDAVDERALVAEVMVDGRCRHTGAGAELADGESCLAAGGEQRLGSVENDPPRDLGLEVPRACSGGTEGQQGGV